MIRVYCDECQDEIEEAQKERVYKNLDFEEVDINKLFSNLTEYKDEHLICEDCYGDIVVWESEDE